MAWARRGRVQIGTLFVRRYVRLAVEAARPQCGVATARGYWVFNAQQCEDYEVPDKPPVAVIERNERVEDFVAATGIAVRTGGTSAYYRPAEDDVQMPDQGLFTGTDTSSATEAYYATLLHEISHASGRSSRLDRGFAGRMRREEV